MLDFADAMFVGERNEALAGTGVYTDLSAYIYELVAALPDERTALIAEDLEIYDRTGFVPPMIDGIIQRAICMADADRISARFMSRG